MKLVFSHKTFILFCLNVNDKNTNAEKIKIKFLVFFFSKWIFKVACYQSNKKQRINFFFCFLISCEKWFFSPRLSFFLSFFPYNITQIFCFLPLMTSWLRFCRMMYLQGLRLHNNDLTQNEYFDKKTHSQQSTFFSQIWISSSNMINTIPVL